MYGPTLNTVYKPEIPGWLKIKKSWNKYRKELFPWLLDSQDLPMKGNWERLDSLVWRKEGRGEIWFKSGKSFMDMNHVDKTSGLAQPMNLVKMKVKPECPVILWIWRNLLCTPKYEETFCSARVINMWNDIPYEIKSAGNLNSFKNKLDNWLNSWTTNEVGKGCFKLSHPWYINIITPIKTIKIRCCTVVVIAIFNSGAVQLL